MMSSESMQRGSHRKNSTRGVARPPGGWSITMRKNGIDRHFYVALPFEADAIGAALLAAPKAEFVSLERMSQGDLASVGVLPGKVAEHRGPNWQCGKQTTRPPGTASA